VPRVLKLLKSRWEKAAAISVLEVEDNCGNLEVVSPKYRDPEDKDNGNVIVGVDVPRHQQTLHMLLCTGFTKEGIWHTM
jgi:hypothetical protein